METKFNSQICTTREQSEMLLSLGLRKETADMCLQSTLNDVWSPYISIATPYSRVEAYDLSTDVFRVIPAWSLDRLRELIPENIFTGVRNQWHRVMYNGVLTYEEGDDSLVSFREANIYDRCISCIEWLINEGYFNKEYLV